MKNTEDIVFNPWLDAFKKDELINALKQRTFIKRGDKIVPLETIIDELGRKKEPDAIEPIFEILLNGVKKNENTREDLISRLHNYLTKQSALFALVSMGSDIILEPMAIKLEASETDVRYAATQVIGELAKFGDKKAFEKLSEIANKENEESVIRGFAKGVRDLIKFQRMK